MDCVFVAKRPHLPPEHKIDWKKVKSVLQAKQEHEHYVGNLRDREEKVAGYMIELEGRYFACSSDAQWLREWQADIQ